MEREWSQSSVTELENILHDMNIQVALIHETKMNEDNKYPILLVVLQ